MPVFGAVLTVRPDVDRGLLAADPRLTLGVASGERLPIVLETTSRREDQDVWDALRAIPGVLDVQLAYADFSDLVSFEEL